MIIMMLWVVISLIGGYDDEGKGRVGKCHGYDGYIRVKKLASWGKKFGRPKLLAKTSHFWKI